ncbi:MAG: alpha/beta hydrolase, partial [Dehalococcoidia bacterium]|nr:alpha/beta hydrolase [Dehalococcoidia bacterium]
MMFNRSRCFLWGRAPLALAAIVIVLACGVAAVSGYSAWALSRAKRFPLVATPATFGLQYDDVSFPSAEDAVSLRGWFIPAEGGKRVLIIVHGKDGNRAKKLASAELPVAAALSRRGFSVLMFDLRGHGESGGDRFSLG